MTLDKTSPTPLYRQLSDGILAQIAAGQFFPGEKLPAIREMAAKFNVNNTTVVGAYKHLEQKQAVYSVRGSGTFVTGQANHSNRAAPVSISEDCINFADMTTGEFFPQNDLSRAFDAVLARDGASAFSFAEQRGYLPLRAAICDLLDFAAIPENIQIVEGMGQGLDIVLDALLSPGDTVVLESPSAYGAAFASRGARIVELPLNTGIAKNGPDFDKLLASLKKCKPKIFFLSPTYQFPTGMCYTMDEKTRIIEIANNFGAHIIEADSVNDFWYTTKPTTLKAMDERVIYIKGYERVLAHGLMGFIAAPEGILGKLRVVEASGYIQRGLESFIASGDFNKHAAFLRKQYKKRWQRTVSAAETYLSPYVDVIIPEGGLGLWVSQNFSENFLRHKVLVSPGDLYMNGGEIGFRINFASTSADVISKGIGIIASLIKGEVNRQWQQE